jgi:hypothetical protein
MRWASAAARLRVATIAAKIRVIRSSVGCVIYRDEAENGERSPSRSTARDRIGPDTPHPKGASSSESVAKKARQGGERVGERSIWAVQRPVNINDVGEPNDFDEVSIRTREREHDTEMTNCREGRRDVEGSTLSPSTEFGRGRGQAFAEIIPVRVECW